jgi:hypothetical protein
MGGVIDAVSYIPAPPMASLSHIKPASLGHPFGAAVLRTAKEMYCYLAYRLSEPSIVQH